MDSVPPAEDCSFADLQSSWFGFFKDRKLFFTYRRCQSCGQVYTPRNFTPKQVAELYHRMKDNTAGLPIALLAQTQRGYLDLLLRQADLKPGGYLELGPDIGLFTRETMSRAEFSNYWMVEANREAHPALERLLRGKPHVLLGDAAEIDQVPDGSLAVAVAIHVLDHLLEPQVLLARLRMKLVSGGWLLALTHDGESLLARAFGRRWPAYCLQHPEIYSSTTLKHSLDRAGFDRVRVIKTVNHFPVTYLLRHFLFGVGLGRVPLPELSSWTIGLKLGNIAAVGCRP
jgi:hypothetical protein